MQSSSESQGVRKPDLAQRHMARILMLNANRIGVGTYHRAVGFGRSLAKRGHDVVVMTVSNSSMYRRVTAIEEPRFRVIAGPKVLDEVLPWHASGPLDITGRIVDIAKNRYEIVYAFEYQPNVSIPVFVTKPFKSFKLISDWCDWHAGASYHFGGKKWAHAIDRRFEEFIRYKADHLTVISNTLRDRALSIGIPAERISVVREGVDPEYMRPVDVRVARARLGLPQDAVLIGTIRDSVAAAELLVETLSQLALHLPRVSLVFVGSPPAVLRGVAERAGVLDRTILPGWVNEEDLPYYLGACDVLALPLEDSLNNWSRWPHKLGDMISVERPVVTSIGGEFPEILGRGNSAWVVPFTAEGFAGGILEILRDPQAAAAMARRGRLFAVDSLAWDIVGGQVAHVVDHLL